MLIERNDCMGEKNNEEKIYVSWKRIIDTGITSNSTPGVIAVGDGGILYPFEHQASHKELKLKSVCQYRDGILIIGDWKMFMISAISGNIETTVAADVVDCTSIVDSNGIQHVYIVTSEGHVLYTSSNYPEYEFKIMKNISNKFTGCRAYSASGTQVVILYGESMLIGTPGASLNSFKRIAPKVSIDSVDILPNGNIVILDNGTQSLDVISNDYEIINKIEFMDFVRKGTDTKCKFNSIHVYGNVLYLLGTYGVVGMIKLQPDGNIGYASNIDTHYLIKDFYFTKISNIHWNDLIKVNNWFIAVGEGEIDKSTFIIDNLPNFIVSHDFRHRRVDYTNEIMKLSNRNDVKYVIRQEIKMKIDDDNHPYFNLNEFLCMDIVDGSIIDEIVNNQAIIIMPLYGHINGKQNWKYDVKRIDDTTYIVYFPHLKCNSLSATVSVKI